MKPQIKKLLADEKFAKEINDAIVGGWQKDTIVDDEGKVEEAVEFDSEIATKLVMKVVEKNLLIMAFTEEKNTELINQVIDYFNVVCKTQYTKKSKPARQMIGARLSEGHTLDDLKIVITSKFDKWGSDLKMREYLRPVTLFGTQKFEGYLMEARRTIKPRKETGENKW